MNRVPSKRLSRRTRVAMEPASSSSLRACSDRRNPLGERACTSSVTLGASAAEQANAFLSAAGQRKHARRSSPAPRGL